MTKNYCPYCKGEILYKPGPGGKSITINRDGTTHLCNERMMQGSPTVIHTEPGINPAETPEKTAGTPSPAAASPPGEASPAAKEEVSTAPTNRDMMAGKDRIILWEWAYGRAIELAGQGIPVSPTLSEVQIMGVKRDFIRENAEWFVKEIDGRIERKE